MFCKLFCCIVVVFKIYVAFASNFSPELTRIWGPGLQPDVFVLPARYFFIQAVDNNNNSIISSLKDALDVRIEGVSKTGRVCRTWANILDRKDGSYIVRYKLYETCKNLAINVKYNEQHVAASPYFIDNEIQPEDCFCPKGNLKNLLEAWDCSVTKQLKNDLNLFETIDWNQVRHKLIEKYDNPGAVSLCHYVIKNGNIYNKCYGKYVGFKMFMDAILLSLQRKVELPDLEFFVNLGDWPLVREKNEIYPIFSWCGSTESYDIVMPTYDITESTLENMGRVTLDILSVQGNVESVWKERIPKLFWRGRDSNKNRLKLIDISRENPELFNVSLTNFFFYRDLQDTYGPKSDHVSFFKFMDYKYQLNLDGTVAAYRLPYLLAGGSLVFKQESKYYEHFYHELIPNLHYIPIEENLSDLVEKIMWAKEDDAEAKKIAKTAQQFVNDNLLPKNIFCYYGNLLHLFSKKVVSKIEVLPGMEKVESTKKENKFCDCTSNKNKDEL